jgi:hypothetical protein
MEEWNGSCRRCSRSDYRCRPDAVSESARPPESARADGQAGDLCRVHRQETVDKDHRLWIWLFDNPDSSTWPDSTPLAVGMLTENGAMHKFTGLPKQVYFGTAYDQAGGYDGTAGPPPAGTPISVYGMGDGGTAKAVETGGDDAVVKATFDDSFLMP